MTLHVVSKSPFSCQALHDCLQSLAEGDALLLIEDGVYALQHQALQSLHKTKIYCLSADSQARGLQTSSASDSVEMIDDTRWVQLCTEHNPIVSWFR
ncbi:sulfurtransferase complex subunit TusB [Microbulbifer sp. THAF38]|uniref:sulfurtransferase complex subunit TusB n=1 Tax=Microbulbifer sp. THAF38 TaxID=2587856 RepID=UPI0012692579|nr:sulfurtransferase complex subunit TusB [Microbulbifer sp. THAF38]QFT54668.1 Protein TusB [Microbulbifer sp. THAF38]